MRDFWYTCKKHNPTKTMTKTNTKLKFKKWWQSETETSSVRNANNRTIPAGIKVRRIIDYWYVYHLYYFGLTLLEWSNANWLSRSTAQHPLDLKTSCFFFDYLFFNLSTEPSIPSNNAWKQQISKHQLRPINFAPQLKIKLTQAQIQT